MSVFNFFINTILYGWLPTMLFFVSNFLLLSSYFSVLLSNDNLSNFDKIENYYREEISWQKSSFDKQIVIDGFLFYLFYSSYCTLNEKHSIAIWLFLFFLFQFFHLFLFRKIFKEELEEKKKRKANFQSKNKEILKINQLIINLVSKKGKNALYDYPELLVVFLKDKFIVTFNQKDKYLGICSDPIIKEYLQVKVSQDLYIFFPSLFSLLKEERIKEENLLLFETLNDLCKQNLLEEKEKIEKEREMEKEITKKRIKNLKEELLIEKEIYKKSKK